MVPEYLKKIFPSTKTTESIYDTHNREHDALSKSRFELFRKYCPYHHSEIYLFQSETRHMKHPFNTLSYLSYIKVGDLTYSHQTQT